MVLASCLFGMLDFRLDVALRCGGTGTATARSSCAGVKRLVPRSFARGPTSHG